MKEFYKKSFSRQWLPVVSVQIHQCSRCSVTCVQWPSVHSSPQLSLLSGHWPSVLIIKCPVAPSTLKFKKIVQEVKLMRMFFKGVITIIIVHGVNDNSYSYYSCYSCYSCCCCCYCWSCHWQLKMKEFYTKSFIFSDQCLI